MKATVYAILNKQDPSTDILGMGDSYSFELVGPQGHRLLLPMGLSICDVNEFAAKSQEVINHLKGFGFEEVEVKRMQRRPKATV